MRQCLTAVVDRNVTWDGDFATEPWEAAWAREAIFFVRLLAADGEPAPDQPVLAGRVQLSPDGMHWCDEGTELRLAAGQGLGLARVSHFGGWLRLRGTIAPGVRLRVIAYLTLKD